MRKKDLVLKSVFNDKIKHPTTRVNRFSTRVILIGMNGFNFHKSLLHGTVEKKNKIEVTLLFSHLLIVFVVVSS